MQIFCGLDVILPARREGKRKYAPDVFGEFSPCPATDGFDRLAHDAQAESGAISTRDRVAMRAVKFLKKLLSLVSGDANPVVRGPNDDLAVFLGVRPIDRRFDRDPTIAPGAVGILDPVRHVVHKA